MARQSGHRKPHKFYVGILILITFWMGLPGIASMQVIDRDEARYAQATVQMVESGDYINIRFQDRARNKKPAGIYWMQATFVKAFTEPGERKIWAHRLVSVLGALLAVLATYWGALAVLGRRGAFWSAAILATTIALSFEAHIAKTDAMLCGLSALCLACLLRLQKQDDNKTAFIFWIALAAAIMIKGPITLAIIILTLITYAAWQKEWAWMRSLVNVPGIMVALLMIIPWAITIGLETNGAFFKDSIAGDMGSKIVSGQESHGALPGYYAVTLPVFFWPGILLLVPGLVFAYVTARKNLGDDDLRRAVRLLICWVLPFWIILELVPTKLPNYPLPLYPALAMFCGGAFLTLEMPNMLLRSRRMGAGLFFIIGTIAVIGVFAGEALYSTNPSSVFYIFPVLVFLAMTGTMFMWLGDSTKATVMAVGLTALLTPITYGHIFPRLDDLRIAERIKLDLTTHNFKPKRILSPNFTEPSLVYALGTNLLLGDKADSAIEEGLTKDDLIIIDEKEAEKHHAILRLTGQVNGKENCLKELSFLKGTNYSKGDLVEIKVYIVEACSATAKN